MKREPLVSIVIVNYNGERFLPECFESLHNIDYKNIEIVIVDNASIDDSLKVVKKYKKYFHIILLRNPKNLGYAEANNIGMLKASGEFVLLLNNDTVVEKKFLSKLVKVFILDKNVAVVQPKIIFYVTKKLQSAGTFLTDSGFLYYVGFNKNPNLAKYNKEIDIFSSNGACMLVRRKVIDKIGLFDPDYFAYFEETDFCWRVWLNGYKVSYVPESVIYHKGAGTSKRFSTRFIQFNSFKNRINSILKNASYPYLLKILFIHMVLLEIASLAYLLTGKINMVFAIQNAILWNLLNLRKTLVKRSEVQRLIRKKRDTDIRANIVRNVKLSYYFNIFFGLRKFKD